MVKMLSGVPEGSFVRSSFLPGSPAAARKALSRAAGEGTLLFIRPGLYYRGAMTRYGMATPSIQEVVTAVFGREGVGPAGFSAARAWGVTTQVPATFHVATLKPVAAIAGVRQVSRRNLARMRLNQKEIALLELLRAPEVYVEGGWASLVAAVSDAQRAGLVNWENLLEVGATEPNVKAKLGLQLMSEGLNTLAA